MTHFKNPIARHFMIALACLTLLGLLMGRLFYEFRKNNTSHQPNHIEKILSEMSLEEKVGQLFFARVPAYSQEEMLQKYHLGGYILFGRDYEGQTLESLKSTLSSYQKASKIPLLIGSDEEGGSVTRLSSLLENPFPSPMILYNIGGLPAIKEDVASKGRLLRSLGIHTGLFPVADIASYGDAFIFGRTIGRDVSETSKYIKAVVKEETKAKLGSTLKHFPGYGDNGDSHTDIIYDYRDLDSLRAVDFKPFKAGIDAGADSILVSHNILLALDDVPSSISKPVLQLLRKELGFEGVLMTDDLDMAGLANFMSQEEAAYQAIKAGEDMVLSSSYESQIPYVIDKVHQGKLSEKRIDQSVKRILKWKAKLGLLE